MQDKNGDQHLTHKEIKKYLKNNDDVKMLLTVPGEKWADLWTKMDTDTRNSLIDEDVSAHDRRYLDRHCLPWIHHNE